MTGYAAMNTRKHQPLPRWHAFFARWTRMFALIAEFWRARPLAWSLSFGLEIINSTRRVLFVLGPAGFVGALVDGHYGGRTTVFWIGVFAASLMIEQLYWGLGPIIHAYMVDYGTYQIEKQILERAASSLLVHFEDGRFFEYLQRTRSQLGERLLRVWTSVVRMVDTVLSLVMLAALLTAIHPLVTVALLLGVIPATWIEGRVTGLVYEARNRHITNDRLRRHIRDLLTTPTHAPEIRLLDCGSVLLDRWLTLVRDRQRDILAAHKRRAVVQVASGILAGGSVAVAMTLVLRLIVSGDLSVGDYVAIVGATQQFSTGLNLLNRQAREIEEQRMFVDDLFRFREMVAPTAEPPVVTDVPAAPAPAKITLCGVSFTYPTREEPSVIDVSLEIREGERVAIVGENGAGKTTLVKILTGLYKPNEGVVYFDGEPLTPEASETVQKKIAVVFQDFSRFELMIRENIGFGDVARLSDDEGLVAAAGRVAVDYLIRQQPDGLDAYLGRLFGSQDISGGEWQRLALARAFFRNAEVLVFDEPTAALDPMAELTLLHLFADISKDKTAIIVSHRLAAARLADRIVVMRNGRIVEEGTHNELMALNGEYKTLFEAQGRWYR